MATVSNGSALELETLADLIENLGGIPPRRILLHPLPSTATEKDVLAARDSPRRLLCELVDGVLVEKEMGAKQSLLAVSIIQDLAPFVEEHDLGVVLGEAGSVRLMPGLVRIPDVSFISWSRLPDQEMPERGKG